MKPSILPSLIGISLLLLFSGCYNAKVTTDLEPSLRVHDQPFASSWIYGLVPPKQINAAEHCSNGVAQVETKLSFVNSLVGIITLGIYTPMHITVTCASGSAAAIIDHNRQLTLLEGASENDVRTVFSQAASLSAELNKPVFITTQK